MKIRSAAIAASLALAAVGTSAAAEDIHIDTSRVDWTNPTEIRQIYVKILGSAREMCDQALPHANASARTGCIRALVDDAVAMKAEPALSRFQETLAPKIRYRKIAARG